MGSNISIDTIKVYSEEAKNILKNITQVVRTLMEKGNLTLTVNGTVVRPDKQSFNSTEPEVVCLPGQFLKDVYCCKYKIVAKLIIGHTLCTKQLLF